MARWTVSSIEAGTMLLIVGAPEGAFASTWAASHFEGIPRP